MILYDICISYCNTLLGMFSKYKLKNSKTWQHQYQNCTAHSRSISAILEFVFPVSYNVVEGCLCPLNGLIMFRLISLQTQWPETVFYFTGFILKNARCAKSHTYLVKLNWFSVDVFHNLVKTTELSSWSLNLQGFLKTSHTADPQRAFTKPVLVSLDLILSSLSVSHVAPFPLFIPPSFTCRLQNSAVQNQPLYLFKLSDV